MDNFEKIIGCITVTAFSCCITTGLILTFATSGGISAGAIPFAIGACIVMCITVTGIVVKTIDYFGTK
jgi:hypothetical protein